MGRDRWAVLPWRGSRYLLVRGGWVVLPQNSIRLDIDSK